MSTSSAAVSCQTKQPKVHKAALVPLVSKGLWERVQMDLIDYHTRPSHGYSYVWHAEDHFSKFHFAFPLVSKSAVEVARCVRWMLMSCVQIKILQCDNGGEFMAGVLDVCKKWGTEVVNSSPYHPQTNGLVERYGSVMKRAIAKWEEQEQSSEWSEVVELIATQLNVTAPRTTKRTPHELVHGIRQRWDSVPMPLDHAALISVMSQDDSDATPAKVRMATESAATLLANLQLSHTASPSPEQDTPVAVDGLSGEADPRTSRTQSPVPDAEPRSPERAALIFPTSDATDSGDSTDDDDYDRPSVRDLEEHKALDDEALRAYCEDDALRDEERGVLGPISRSMAVDLDAGPGTWRRCGIIGSGRCCLGAFLQAERSGSADSASDARGDCFYRGWSVQSQLDACDNLRRELRAWMTGLRGPARRTLQSLVVNTGNSGVDRRHVESNSRRPATAAELSQQAWDTLLRHLSVNDEQLGWDCLVALSEFKHVNILLYAQVHNVEEFAADTKQAIDRWAAAVRDGRAAAEAARQGRARPGGSWRDNKYVISPVLVPCRAREAWPFICVYHRSENHITTSMNEGLLHVASSGGGGHFETLLARCTPDDAPPPGWRGTLTGRGCSPPLTPCTRIS